MTLALLCAAALAGLLAGTLNERLSVPGLVASAALASIGAALAWRRAGWRLVALACVALALGALRAQLAQPNTPRDADPLASFANLQVTLDGRVASAPVRTERSLRVLLEVDAVDQQPIEPAAARVLLIAEPTDEATQLTVGDRLAASGRLGSPQGEQQPRALVFPRITRVDPAPNSLLGAFARARAVGIQTIEQYVSQPQASLAAGVLFGGTGQLGQDFKLDLQRSGLAHILAIDGYKQLVVTAVLAAVAVRLVGRPWAALPILIGVAGYTLLTGARPSATRAALMVSTSLLAGVLGRLPDALTSLLAAATIMAAIEPSVLLELGFQLSFSATLGLVLLWPRLRRGLHRVPRFVAEPAGVTMAVTIATLPVALSAFGAVSLISPLAHIVAIPLLPPLLITTALLAVSGAAPPLARVLGWLVAVQTDLLAGIVEFFGSLPVAALSTGHLPPVGAAALAASLVLVGVSQQPDLRDARAWLGAKLPRARWVLPPAACAFGVMLALLVRPSDGALHIQQLSVAPGEAVFVRAPSGQTVLLARGKLSTRALQDGVAAQLSVLEHDLDVVVSLDAEADAGLKVVEKTYPAERTLYAVDQRVDLGNATVLDVYADGSAVLTSGVASIDLLRSGPTTSAARPAAAGR